MGTVFQIVSIILIIGAVFLFCRHSEKISQITKAQKALAVLQIVLCGGFFALCVSDVLDIKVNFSAVRLILNLFYGITFLALSAFALSDLHRKKQLHIQIIVCACAALIAAQCFVFPYETENELKRIIEAIEGVVVFTLLLLLITRISDKKFGQNALFIIILLELGVAILNTALPIASITEDIQSIDVPMNYLSLYMRPVIFSSLALIYRVWLDFANHLFE